MGRLQSLTRFNHTATSTAAAYSPNIFKLAIGPQDQTEVYSTQVQSGRMLDNYKIDFAKPDDTPRIINYMEKNFFCENALTKSLNMCYLKMDPSLEFYVRDLISQGMTMVARDRSSMDQIVGISVNQKSCKWDGDKLDDLAHSAKNHDTKKLLHIWGLLAREPKMNEYLSQQTIFDVKFISVTKLLQGQGLASELVKRSLCLGLDLNFKYARLEATDDITNSIAKEYDMEKLWEVRYKNIVEDDGETAITLPEVPNTSAAVYYYNLKASPSLKPVESEEA